MTDSARDDALEPQLGVAELCARLRPRRRIRGMSAVLLPFEAGGGIDWRSFRAHVARTAEAGLVPAVNMDTGYVQLLDDGIRWAEEVGIYVIIDWHSIGNLRTELFQHPMYNTTKTETLRFWKAIAARYGNRPAVAFYELFNEPTRFNGTLGRATWAEHKVLMEEIIYVIRAHNAVGIPLVAGFNWAYDLTEAGADYELLKLLKRGMGDSQGYEIRWSSD